MYLLQISADYKSAQNYTFIQESNSGTKMHCLMSTQSQGYKASYEDEV